MARAWPRPAPRGSPPAAVAVAAPTIRVPAAAGVGAGGAGQAGGADRAGQDLHPHPLPRPQRAGRGQQRPDRIHPRVSVSRGSAAPRASRSCPPATTRCRIADGRRACPPAPWGGVWGVAGVRVVRLPGQAAATARATNPAATPPGTHTLTVTPCGVKPYSNTRCGCPAPPRTSAGAQQAEQVRPEHHRPGRVDPRRRQHLDGHRAAQHPRMAARPHPPSQHIRPRRPDADRSQDDACALAHARAASPGGEGRRGGQDAGDLLE